MGGDRRQRQRQGERDPTAAPFSSLRLLPDERQLFSPPSISSRSPEMETSTRRAAGWVFLGSVPFSTLHSPAKVAADPTAHGVPSRVHAPPIPSSGIGPNSVQSAFSLPEHDEPFGMIRLVAI